MGKITVVISSLVRGGFDGGDFAELGYRYDVVSSTPDQLVFICDEFGGLGLSVRLTWQLRGKIEYNNTMIKKIAIFVGSILLSLAAGGVGSLATIPNIPSWYAGLDKPPLLPPNEVFGPTWAVLYLLMGIALALIILHKADGKKSAYLWFGVQLVLNASWSIVFFGLHQPWLAIVIIVALIGSIIMTGFTFRKFVPAAAWLLVPYLAWVCFATYLNLGVALLN